MRVSLRWLVAAQIVCMAFGSFASAEETDLQALLEESVGLVVGEWSTYNQVQDQIARGLPEELRVPLRHDIYKRVDLPQFGTHVVYAQKYRDGDPADVFIQNLYVFSIDVNREAVVLELFEPTYPDSIRSDILDGHIYPERLQKLKMKNVFRMRPGCRTVWRKYSDDSIRGGIDRGCDLANTPAAAASRYDTIVGTSDFILTENEWWIRSRAHDGEYNRVYGTEMHRRYQRARQFECFSSAKSQQAENGIEQFRGMVVHDLGGRATFGAAGDGRRPYALQLHRNRNLNEVLPVGRLALTVTHDGETFTAATSTDAEQISVSALGFTVTCDRLLQLD